MNTPYKKISIALEKLLKGLEYKIESTPSDTEPLFLLLTFKPNLAVFSVLDGRPEENYLVAFQNFKNLYSAHSTEWANFDLSLVLCSTDAEKTTDEFFNKIQIDPYFCRKFVIDLNKELQTQLGLLPYIPLSPEKIVGLRRPISSQTFLIQHGVTSELAKYLVVPHVRGIERIIKDCVEGVLGVPEWITSESDKFYQAPYKISHKIRLKELEINNFRVYRGNFKFDLDGDLVVLFGPNGLGKTSFFDAIDFICTGGVARFDERFKGNTNRLLDALKHLDSSIDTSFVNTNILVDGKEIPLERCVNDRIQANLSGVPQNRTKTLMNLTGLSEEHSDLRIENLIRLFRATHLFGQEFQVLTSKLREYSKLPEDTVSRMLSLQDYVETINKTKRVCEELKSQIKDKETELSKLKDFLQSKKSEYDQLTHSAKIAEKPETILEIGKNILEKISREANIQIKIPKEYNQEIIREWRALLTAHIGSIKQKLELINKLEVKFPELADYKKNLEEVGLKLAQKKKILSAIIYDHKNKEKKLQGFDDKLKQMLLEEKNLSSKKENLNWLLQAKVEYNKLKENVKKEDENYKDIQSKLLKLIPKIEKIKSKNKQAQETSDKISSEIEALEKNLNTINALVENLEDWQKTITLRKELEASLQKNQRQLDKLRNELRVKKDELNNALIDKVKLKSNLEKLQESQSELHTLLDNIKKHVLGSICPVCGTSHKSKEDLIEKLDIQRGIQPKHIQEALKLYEEAERKTDKLKKYVIDFESELKRLAQQDHEVKNEFSQLESSLKNYEAKAIALDIQIIPEKLMEEIASKKKYVTEQINIKRQELSEQESKTKKLNKQLAVLDKQRDILEQDLRTSESRQKQLQSMIDKISGDASTRQVSLELKNEIIQRELSPINGLIDDLCNKIKIQQTENQKLQKEIGQLLEKKNKLEREIQELNNEILGLTKYIEEVEDLIKSLKLKSDLNMDYILALEDDLKRKLSSLDFLQNEIENFEIALDTIQISASLAKIKQEMENIKKQHHELENYRNKLITWLSYFDNIRNELYSIQNQALKEYTVKYGPLTSIIQKRLRAVYGFGNISLNPEKGGIAVRVQRQEKKNIAPSDYFSESQIQIIMLSLFLSAVLTQTWSSFAPILLDDPVEHFDDMNAYSLLELISGLIMQSNGEHQFIISTCEGHLFRLMREKFSKINCRVIYYVFESIGENGPKIKMLKDY
jgi:exonuclease SbcC